MKINAKTKMFCLIGNPVGHSASPAMHNAAFEKLGLNCAYFACQVEESGLEFAVEAVRSLGFGGANVTIPYKGRVLGLVDCVDPLAEKIGAVNTIVNKDRVLKGFNTDAFGAFEALARAGVKLRGADVVVLGAGGAAKAVCFALAEWGKIDSLSILDKDVKAARKLAEHLHRETGVNAHADEMSRENLERGMRHCSVVANCTPVGMTPGESLVPKGLMRKELAFFDAVYKAGGTKMLKDAASLGCKTVGGEKMLLFQGVKGFELWTGKKAPVEVMERAVLAELGQRK